MDPDNHPGLNGILKWSIQYHDGTRPSEVGRMAEERRKFLREVFDSMVVDYPKRLRQIMNLIHDFLVSGNFTDREVFYATLNELCDIVESIDMAQLFVQMGGTDDLILLCNHSSVILKAVSCISTLCQNHPFVQADFLKKGAFKTLLSHATDPNNAIELQSKCLNAISCLIRGLPEVEAEFVKDVSNTVFSIMIQNCKTKLTETSSNDDARNALKIIVKILFLSSALMKPSFEEGEVANYRGGLSCGINLALGVISSVYGGDYWLSEDLLSSRCEGFVDLLELSVCLLKTCVLHGVISTERHEDLPSREDLQRLFRTNCVKEEWRACMCDLENILNV